MEQSSSMYANTKCKVITKDKEMGVLSTDEVNNDNTATKWKNENRPSIPRARRCIGSNPDYYNFLLHQYYIQNDFKSCKALIEDIEEEWNDLCEYPKALRGKIALRERDLKTALLWFKKAQTLRPKESEYLREIGHIQFLMGDHKKAAETSLDAIRCNPNDKKAYYWRALALFYSDQSDISITQVEECLLSAPGASDSVETLLILAMLYRKRNEIPRAIQVYEKAIQLKPENPDALVNLGLLYLQEKEETQAFAALGKALSYNSGHYPSILAAGSLIQDGGDYDVALTKYRTAADNCDYHGPLWNNIGMCFFAKGKHVAAISCLKKAAYLCPLDWKIDFNLGLVHFAVQQYASAYHFFSAANNLNPNASLIYMALAVTLTYLNDEVNARKAYGKAISLDEYKTPQIGLNFAIFEAKQGNIEKSTEYLKQFEENFAGISRAEEMKAAETSLRNFLKSG